MSSWCRVLGSASFAIVAFASATSACVDVLGIEPLRRDTCEAPPYAEQGCVGCVRDACCVESAACSADPACRGADVCVAGCARGDPACRYGCFEQHRDGMADERFVALDECRRASCLDPCIGPGGWEKFYASSAACAECSDKCAVDASACLGSWSCDTVTSCLASCKDPECNYSCFDIEPYRLYREEVGPLEECLGGCAGACGVAGDFSCVDKYTWLGGDAAPSTGELWFVDAGSGKGLPGITARACPEVDCPTCFDQSGPDTAITGDDGRLTLPVPYGFRGCVALQGGGITPLLVFLAWPVTTNLPARPSKVAPNLPLENLAKIFNLHHIPGRGVLYLEQHDCPLTPHPIVTFESSNVDELTEDFAYNNGQISFAVGAQGNEAIVFSHPLGTTTITGYADGEEVSSAIVYVQPDVITYVVLMPRSGD